MKVDVSEITIIDGASADFTFEETLSSVELPEEEISIDGPVRFTGRLTGMGGILKLKGKLIVPYAAKCYRCLKSIPGQMTIDVREELLKEGTPHEEEAFTFSGDTVELDRVVKDNIILSLPMKQLCDPACKGICPRCGADLNESVCRCAGEAEINPQMEKLKDYFKDTKV